MTEQQDTDGVRSDRQKILFVNCCITVHEESRTEKLARAFLDAYLKKHPQAETEERDLTRLGLRPLDPDTVRRRNALSDMYAGRSAETEADFPQGAEEFLEAEKFAQADLIVIAAPYWEMSFPALLRIYIEHVSALNVTFGYGEDGQQRGLCRADHLVYLTTAGGPVAGNDYGGDYLRGMCGVWGIGEFSAVAAECLDIGGADVQARLSEAVRRAQELAERI